MVGYARTSGLTVDGEVRPGQMFPLILEGLCIQSASVAVVVWIRHYQFASESIGVHLKSIKSICQNVA